VLYQRILTTQRISDKWVHG